ncbi:MAG TPA: hypothetical protein DEP84_21315 [Chloroflexi bacterium]|nr:hypothetical protein [Chloroflexota bacterium]
MYPSQRNSYTPQTTDYDLHGLACIRLLDASPDDVAAVTRQLGPIQASLTREPDILIRFVDRLPTPSRVRYLGVDEAGFTDDAFLVLRSKHKSRVTVQIDFEQIGRRQCEIVCERGLPAVPLLIPILNLTVLSRGALPLHASAFTYNGTGVVTTGWSKGGKTETLLAFMARGAEYIGDEWVYISSNGQHIYGIPEPIRLWNWHLDSLPQYRTLVGRNELVRLRALKLFQSLELVGPPHGARSAPVRALNRVMPLLKRQLYVDVHPQRLFGNGFGLLAGTFDRLFFVVSHELPEVIVQPIDPQEIARRMVFSLQHERLDFTAYYLKFRFAFPEAHNQLIERAEELQHAMLTRVLADKDTYAVYHPYPVPIASLFDAIGPLL